MKTTTTRKIGTNKNKARIWIEGAVLSSQGWKKGDEFICQFKDAEKEIVFAKVSKSTDPNADNEVLGSKVRRIAGTPERPIIDTNTDNITDCLGMDKGDLCEIIIEDNVIVVRKASTSVLASLKAAGKRAITSILVAAASLAPLTPSDASAYESGAKRILVACEYSGRVRDALVAAGHDAVSCDILESEGDAANPHVQGDVTPLLAQKWDMILAHPPCTYLTGAALWRNSLKHDPTGERAAKTEIALKFVAAIMNADCPQIAVENPRGCISTRLFKDSSGTVRIKPLEDVDGASFPATQTIQPWQFGHPESKGTSLWLKGLTPLTPTDVLVVEEHGHQNPETGKWFWQNQTPTGQNRLAPSADRGKKRSLTYSGIAAAMGQTWGAMAQPAASLVGEQFQLAI